MKRPAAVVVIIVIAGFLGFHWISYPAPKGRTFCVMPKDHLTFKETFLTADSQIGFTFSHPILAGKIITNDAWCFSI